MAQLSRAQVSDLLGKLYSRRFNGKVWASYDPSCRAYCIRGENLPSHPDLTHLYPHGWGLLDYIKPTNARNLISQEKDNDKIETA